jgi:hypothetical protein
MRTERPTTAKPDGQSCSGNPISPASSLPKESKMNTADYALGISLLALVISISGLVWNIWQKFIFVKPALQVHFGIFHHLKTEANSEFANPSGHRLLVLTVTNKGPGQATLYACVAKAKRERWWMRPKYGTVNPIHNYPLSQRPLSGGPFSGGLPAKIDPSETKTFYFPYTKECFLRAGINRVGITDTFGRNTWCSRRSMRKTSKSYLEDFG